MKILVATDGSEFSVAAIEKCCQMVIKPENTEIKIVSALGVFAPVAIEPFAISADYIRETEAIARKEATDAVTQAEATIRACFPNASIEITTKIDHGSPDRVIIEEAESWGADLIVVGSHGYGFWSRMLLGSVSQAVIQHARCSVLIVRKTGNLKDKTNK